MERMRAVRLIQVGQPLALETLSIPAIGPDDVLVRVRAAGICHSDVHYRAGISPVGSVPLTLGHEVAGLVQQVGENVVRFSPGDRVCLHYMITCGQCAYCHRGHEQFCVAGRMLGKHLDGGYADHIAVPARSVFHLPEEIPFTQGAVMMCSSATSLHALRKGRLQPGDWVAVFGCGGLGLSAIQLARALGAHQVYAVDIDAGRLALAERLGATPVDGAAGLAAERIRRLSGGRGVDLSLELVGLQATMRQAVDVLAIMGRAVMVGLSDQQVAIAPYQELINREAEIIGCSDHLAQEIPLLIDLVCQGLLDLGSVVTAELPLEAAAINQAMDGMERYGSGGVRTVIVP